MVRGGCGGSAGERLQNCPAWIGLGGGGLYGNLEEWLEMRSKYSGKLSRRYPVLACVKVTREVESMIVKTLCLLVEFWEGGQ